MTFAYNEMRLILARVLYEFKLEQVGELLDWDKLNAWGATEKQAMIVKVVPSN
jgi:cytochrome P450